MEQDGENRSRRQGGTEQGLDEGGKVREQGGQELGAQTEDARQAEDERFPLIKGFGEHFLETRRDHQTDCKDQRCPDNRSGDRGDQGC